MAACRFRCVAASPGAFELREPDYGCGDGVELGEVETERVWESLGESGRVWESLGGAIR
jgi:hypothetical protein